MAKNSNLHNAKTAKNDEFYTQLTDIEKELKHYKKHFEGKVVYCNCDDVRWSNFFKYFSMNFEHLGLKKLICTAYNENGQGIVYEYNGDLNGNRIVDDEEIEVKYLEGNGDFRSAECIEILKQADIVVTNPPFSLFREYVTQLMEYGKQFLIIGNGNAVTYKEIFPLIKENKMWLGTLAMGSETLFLLPTEMEKWIVENKKEGSAWVYSNGKIMGRVTQVIWFTNLDHAKRHTELDLYKKYNAEEYPKYDNYDAIEVSKVAEIPMDYFGEMGVPISFLNKYCPTQFEIVGIMSGAKGECFTNGNDGRAKFYINDKGVYARILIKHIS